MAKTIFEDSPYQPQLDNWYSSKPYGFKFTFKSGDSVTMYLPISPSNLNISTVFATNIVPTIFGTVEEHSPVRYFDITIEGNTGMGPKYVLPASGAVQSNLGRSSFAVNQAFDSSVAAGFFLKTLTKATDIFSAVNDLLHDPGTNAGLRLDQTGYLAFHNLYRFLLKYKSDVSSTETRTGEDVHPLVFFNYKDNNQYNVVVRGFTMKRDATDPMLYHYAISMRGYNLAVAGTSPTAEPSLLASLGLNGLSGSNLLGTIQEKANEARGILASGANGLNQLGR